MLFKDKQLNQSYFRSQTGAILHLDAYVKSAECRYIDRKFQAGINLQFLSISIDINSNNLSFYFIWKLLRSLLVFLVTSLV